MANVRTLMFAALIFSFGSISFASSSDESVARGWKALEPASAESSRGGGQSEAEKNFRAALDTDTSNTRAYLGLSLLYDMQERKHEAWNVFKTVLTTEQGIRYLDLTANNFPYGSAPPPDVNALSLLIAPNSRTPEYLAKKEFTTNNVYRTTTVTVAANNGINVKHVSKRTGTEYAAYKKFYNDALKEDEKQIVLRKK